MQTRPEEPTQTQTDIGKTTIVFGKRYSQELGHPPTPCISSLPWSMEVGDGQSSHNRIHNLDAVGEKLSPDKTDCTRHPISSKTTAEKGCFALFDQIVDYIAEKKQHEGQSMNYIELYNRVSANHFP